MQTHFRYSTEYEQKLKGRESELYSFQSPSTTVSQYLSFSVARYLGRIKAMTYLSKEAMYTE